MKKIWTLALAALLIAVMVSSCGSSRKTGCPDNQGMVL